MALNGVYVTAPAAAAAMGLYLFGKNISNTNDGEDGGMAGMTAPKDEENERSEKKSTVAVSPKLAPQFDGLHCFETIVSR
ncbi:hypothetical protein SASPL_119109 [Salvia splendens]|uniref:Uncharacterized protein n=1 Tax=Salvia splendens TaxID=180675 RepID=A0A8X9A0J7_SALSN|nr:hypothetical protein SASPL_119109 [Salvia splendens]